MFIGKARAYPIEEPSRFSTLGKAADLAHKQLTGLERDHRSNLLRIILNYGQKSFITLGTGVYRKVEYMKVLHGYSEIFDYLKIWRGQTL